MHLQSNLLKSLGLMRKQHFAGLGIPSLSHFFSAGTEFGEQLLTSFITQFAEVGTFLASRICFFTNLGEFFLQFSPLRLDHFDLVANFLDTKQVSGIHLSTTSTAETTGASAARASTRLLLSSQFAPDHCH